MGLTISLMPWFGFVRSLLFWQATWFLYFQSQLSAAEAILLYAIYDVTTTALEVPSGYVSDVLGRKLTLILSAVAGAVGCALLALGGGEFTVFLTAQIALGAHAAFVSGTDSAILFEALHEEGRVAEVEQAELRVWRFSFAGLALSAVTGGAMALVSPALPFAASTFAFVVLAGLCLFLREPAHARAARSAGFAERVQTLNKAFRRPVLVWLFALSVLMYGFSHVPFVFGQPFIDQALRASGLSVEAPLVSGAVTTIMMVISVLVSLAAPWLRHRLGLAVLLLLAFGIQIGLAAVLAVTSALWAVAFLFLRMVPDSLSRAFILARVQPLLEDQTRATYLSLKSFLGRLLFAVSLYFAAGSASDAGMLERSEISLILSGYALAGAAAWVALALAGRRTQI